MSSSEPPEEDRRQEEGQGGRKTRKTHRSVSGGIAAAGGGCWPCGQEKMPELKVEYDSTDEEEYTSTCAACRGLPRGTLCKTHKSRHAQNTASRRFRARTNAYITDLVRRDKAQTQGITQLVAIQQSHGIALPDWASTYLPKIQQRFDYPPHCYASVAPASAIPGTSKATVQQVAQSNYSAYGHSDHHHQGNYHAPPEQPPYPPSMSTVSVELAQSVSQSLPNNHGSTASSHPKYGRYEYALQDAYGFARNGTTDSGHVLPSVDKAMSSTHRTDSTNQQSTSQRENVHFQADS